MAFRIHFTLQDLARTRVADAPLPMTELDLAARALQDRSQAARLDTWRRCAWPRLSPNARMVLSLIPPVGHSFLLISGVGRFEELLERARAIPRKRIEAELTYGAERGFLPPWAPRLAEDAAHYQQFVDGLTDLHGVLLEPYEPRLADLFVADRTVRMRQLLGGGVERLLSQLNPRWMRWNPPVLEIRMVNGMDYDLYLEGQGVLLMPSMFGSRSIVDKEARPQPTISYPAGHEHLLHRLLTFTPENASAKSTSAAVSALLGRTRAAILTTVAEHPGCSTKELAALVGIAPASASEHATVLRRAGLITTTRHRNTALHSPTDLGIALLNRPYGRNRGSGH